MAVNQSELKHLKLHDHEDGSFHFHRTYLPPIQPKSPAIAQTCASLVVRIYADTLLELLDSCLQEEPVPA